MKHKKTILGAGIVLLFGIFAGLPLFGRGYIPTHDGEYHIIRFIEFFRMFSAGYWFPRWAPNLNSGYGIPIFLFHYPFPNYIGSLFQGLGFHAVSAFQLGLAAAYLLSGVFSLFWLKKMFGIRAGIVGAILSLYVPYWFVDIYVRGSIGEVWAICFMYIFLACVEYRRYIFLPFAVAGLILSHNILAMLFLPFLLGYAYIRNRRFITAIFLGVLLASYFWIPAIFERVYVVGLNTVNFKEHFVQLYELLIPSWGTELSGQSFNGNKMSFQIGILPLLVILGSLIPGWREEVVRTRRLYWYFIIVLVLAIVCTLPWTTFLWDHIPILSFVQYPWRFLSVIIPVTAFLGAYVSFHLHMRFWSIILIVLSVVFSYAYTRPVIYAPRDSVYYLSRANFTDGTSSMGNSFSTIWTGWKKERPVYVLEVKNGKMYGGMFNYSYLKRSFTLWSDRESEVHLPILYFPGWKAIVDQREVSIDFTTDGTIRFAVPPGVHVITVEFTQTLMRRYADILSIVTLVWLLGWGILGVYANRNRHVSS